MQGRGGKGGGRVFPFSSCPIFGPYYWEAVKGGKKKRSPRYVQRCITRTFYTLPIRVSTQAPPSMGLKGEGRAGRTRRAHFLLEVGKDVLVELFAPRQVPEPGKKRRREKKEGKNNIGRDA